jgi:carbon-monoxide dehydrogenase small subunit
MSDPTSLLQIGGTVGSPDKIRITLTVNGEDREILADATATLLEVLREEMNLPGTKHGCELGECGACTVLLDGEPVLSCLLLARQGEGLEITTIEGISSGNELHPLQEAFADLGGSQCGYCTPGFVLSSAALLQRKPDPSRAEIKEALSGNLCRCTGYNQIFESVEQAARKIREEDS